VYRTENKDVFRSQKGRREKKKKKRRHITAEMIALKSESWLFEKSPLMRNSLLLLL